jgi:hypothetical protein
MYIDKTSLRDANFVDRDLAAGNEIYIWWVFI